MENNFEVSKPGIPKVLIVTILSLISAFLLNGLFESFSVFYSYDASILINKIANIISFLLILTGAWNYYKQNKIWKTIKNIVLSYLFSMFFLEILGIMLVDLIGGNNFVSVFLFALLYAVFYAILHQLSEESFSEITNVNIAKKKAFLNALSLVILIVFYEFGKFIYFIGSIYGMCSGDGYGCKTPDWYFYTFGVVIAIVLLFIWWKLVKRLKTKLLGDKSDLSTESNNRIY